MNSLIDIIGIPINLGCDRDGVELAPDLIRSQNRDLLRAKDISDLGNVECKTRAEIQQDKWFWDKRIKFRDPILPAIKASSVIVSESIKKGRIPVCLGGDHVMAYGTIGGVSLAKGKDNYAVVYIDAHGDFNTEETSTSGNMHGMHMSFLMGLGEKKLSKLWGTDQMLNPGNIYFLGQRALDPGEEKIAKELNLYIQTTEMVMNKKPSVLVSEVVNSIKQKGISHVHLSFDIDVIDPSLAPGTGVPEKNGVTTSVALEIVKELLEFDIVKSADIVEWNPSLDKNNATGDIVRKLLETLLR